MKDKPMPHPNLLPCPFCGSADVGFSAEDGHDFVVCSNCGAEVPFGCKETCIAAWNQRSTWQPIETAPRGGKGSIEVPTEILVWDGYEMRVELPQVGYHPRDTHWHPLPSPPISP